jgi:ketosteroid isomerase-like protein
MPAAARFRAALFAAAVLAPLAAASGHAQALPTPRDDTDERLSAYRSELLRDATATLDRWRAAWGNDDVRTLMRFYNAKAVVQFPGDGGIQQGSSSVETALKAQLPTAGPIEFGLLDAEVSDNLLYVVERYTLLPNAPVATDSAAATPAAAPVTGTATLVLVRERGGWKIRAQMFMPPAQAAATATAAAQPATAAPESATN